MSNSSDHSVLIYTDGACIGSGGATPGGYAALLLFRGHEQIITGQSLATTNTAMELTGVVRALEALPPVVPAIINTDSRYVIMGATEQLPWWRSRGWRILKGGRLANKDLWQRLSSLLTERPVSWCWVKAHSGDPRNEQVHALAYQEARRASGR